MKAGEQKSQIKAGMILSYLNIGIGNLIPLFYTPIMLSLLGQSEYGLYKIASSTTSYLSLVAFGIGSAVTRYLIKARIEGGKEAEEKTFGLFNIIFQFIAVLTLVVGAIITLNLDVLYGASLSIEELFRMRILVGILVVNTAVSFSASSYNAVVSTHERFVFIQGINILSTIGAPVFNIIVLFLGYKSIGMVTTSLALNVVIRIVYLAYVRNVMEIRPRYNNMPKSMLKEIFQFSFWIFVSNIVGQLYNATDIVIIGAIPKLAATGAAVYSIGVVFPQMMFSLAQVTPSLFMPKANKMVFGGSTDTELTNLVIKAGRMQCFMVSLVCSGFIAFGKPFIHYYAGAEYSDAYWIGIIIMIPNCIPLVQSVAHSIIQAKNMHKFRSKVYLLIAVLNVIGTMLLVQRFGIIGAAIPTGISFLIGNGFIMNWFYWKKVHLDIPRFWKQLCPIIVLSGVMCLFTLFISRWIDFYNIRFLVLGIVMYSSMYLIINYMVTMDNSEKRIVKAFVSKIIHKRISS